MRVAALYDVHGNLPALEAVLAEPDVEKADKILVGGDVVAGPWPQETVERLRSLGERVAWIRGNSERELVEGATESLIQREPPVSDETRAFLAELPLTFELDIPELGSVLFCHATPRNDAEIFTARTPEERLAPVFADVNADVVVCGHTHIQFDRRVGGLRVVNAGSVGMAYEDDPGAYWALLGPEIDFRHTGYDVGATLAAIAASGFGDWPAASREEAEAFFEAQALRG